MAQQHACIAQIVDLRRRLWPDVPELELRYPVGQVGFFLQFSLLSGCLSGFGLSVAKHPPAHALPVPLG